MKRIALLLLLFFFGLSSPSSGRNNDVTLAEAFKCRELNFSAANINGWAKIDKPISLEQAEKLICYVYGDYGDKKRQPIQTLKKQGNKTVLTRDYGDCVITLDFTSSSDKVPGEDESVVSIDMTQYSDMENITVIGERLSYCLKKYNPDIHINLCITGYIDNKVEDDKKQQIIDDMFSHLSAKKVEGIETDNLISSSGYTSYLPYSIRCNGRNINLNAASRYSSSDNKTYFWLGTPLINMEY